MKTRYSRVVSAGFDRVFRPWMGHRLGGIHIRGVEGATWLPALPVLLVANHVSWWDGFLLREVRRRLRPDAPLHVVMNARELEKHAMFRWLGAIPLDEDPMAPRRMLASIRSIYEREPGALLGYFPQGRIWPSHRRPLGFLRGGAWLAERLAPAAVLPIALHLEPLTRPGPAAFVSVGRPLLVRDRVETEALERAVTDRLDDILGFLADHGEDAPRLWAPAA